MSDQALFAFGHLRRGRRYFICDFLGNDQHAVLVRMEEVSRPDDHSAHFHRRSEIHQVHVSV